MAIKTITTGDGLVLSATDASLILANAGVISVAVGVGGSSGVAASIGAYTEGALLQQVGSGPVLLPREE